MGVQLLELQTNLYSRLHQLDCLLMLSGDQLTDLLQPSTTLSTLCLINWQPAKTHQSHWTTKQHERTREISQSSHQAVSGRSQLHLPQGTGNVPFRGAMHMHLHSKVQLGTTEERASNSQGRGSHRFGCRTLHMLASSAWQTDLAMCSKGVLMSSNTQAMSPTSLH